jgi:hypothetical protein
MEEICQDNTISLDDKVLIKGDVTEQVLNEIVETGRDDLLNFCIRNHREKIDKISDRSMEALFEKGIDKEFKTVIKLMFQHLEWTKPHLDLAIKMVSFKGDIEMIEFFINLVPNSIVLVFESLIKDSFTDTIVELIKLGHYYPKVANYLIDHADMLTIITFIEIGMKKVQATMYDKKNEMLKYACKVGRKDVVELLLVQKKINVHANNEKSLCNASENGHHEIVELLLRKGANPQIKNFLPLKLAKKCGHRKVLKIISDFISNSKISSRMAEKALEKTQRIDP